MVTTKTPKNKGWMIFAWVMIFILLLIQNGPITWNDSLWISTLAICIILIIATE